MNLMPQQMEALASGEAVSIDINGTPCVVVRQDVYDAVQIGDSDLPSPQATASIIGDVMADDDANDPALEAYQHYRRAP